MNRKPRKTLYNFQIKEFKIIYTDATKILKSKRQLEIKIQDVLLRLHQKDGMSNHYFTWDSVN